MRRRLLSYKPRLEQELAELLERRIDLTHGPLGPTSASIGMPSPRSHGKSLTSSRLSGPCHQYPPPGPVSHRQPEPWVGVDPGKWRTQHIHGIPCLSRQRHFPGDGTSESSKLKYGLHLTDHWPPTQNPKHDIVSSAGPGRFAFSCLELALAGYTTLDQLTPAAMRQPKIIKPNEPIEFALQLGFCWDRQGSPRSRGSTLPSSTTTQRSTEPRRQKLTWPVIFECLRQPCIR